MVFDLILVVGGLGLLVLGGESLLSTEGRLRTRWADALVDVQHDTAVRRHRLGSSLLWRWRCRPGHQGRPRIDKELRDHIRQIARENPTQGATRIDGEQQMLGLDIAALSLRAGDQQSHGGWLGNRQADGVGDTDGVPAKDR
jgi:hypothetical protein